MDVRVLGRLEVCDEDGAPLPLGSPLQRTLLALLLLEPGVVRSDEWLVEHLWADASPPGSPVASLQTYVARARRTLRRRDGSALLVRSGPGYLVDVRPDEVDASRFVALATRARGELRAGHPAPALALAQSALALWRSAEPLPELEDRAVALAARERWREARAGCEEDRLEALMAVGRPEDAVADLELLTAGEPLRERGWLLLLRALQLCGRRADALERYRRVHDLFDDELGIEPGPALRRLHLSILRGEAENSSRPEESTTTPPDGPVATAPGLRTGELDGRAPLVGREAQRASLSEAVSRLPETGPRFAVLEGEPGIGKTRLAEAVTDVARARGIQVAWGRCHEDASVPALWPWRQIASTLSPGHPRLLGDDLSSVFERLRDVVVQAAAVSPVVLVLDDLHWADTASLRLLSFLTRELDRAPVLFLVTTRPGHLSDQHVRTRADLARTRGFQHLPLGPLDPDATAELVRATALDELPGDELDRLCSRSGGNPLFAVELARFVDGSGAISSLPGGVRDVIRRRLAPLTDDAHGILRLAAVLGDRCDLDLLLRSTGPDPSSAASALDAPLAAGLLTAEGDAVGFSHALVRETLLTELSDVERRRLHARVAAARPTDVFEQAHHLVEGRPLTDAATTERACRAAAEQADRDRTYESAARWWQRTLDVGASLTDGGSPRQRTLLALATALVRSGQTLVGQERLHECLEAALAVGDTGTAVEVATVLNGSQGSWYWVEYGTYPTTMMALLEQTLTRLGPEEKAARVPVLLALAAGEQYGDTASASVLADEAVAEARRLGDPAVLAEALAGWLYCTWSCGDEERVVACAGELLELCDALPDALVLALVSHVRRAQAFLVLGDAAASDGDVAKAWDLATHLRLPVHQAQVIQLQGARAVLAGELELAEELYARARVLHERVQVHLAEETDAASLFLLRAEQGRAGELLPLLRELAWRRGSEVDLLLVCATVQSGDLEGARELARRTSALEPARRWWNWEAWVCFQAGLAAELGDHEAAERLVDEMAPVADHVALYGAIAALGPVTRHLGRLEAMLGRWADAEAHLRSCLALSARHGFRPSWADAAVSLAEVLSATGRGEEAVAMLTSARPLAEELGLSGVSARAAVLATAPASLQQHTE